jgi:hypothetical protein
MRYPACPYFGSARHMEEKAWMDMNAIALRSNWRELLDACLEEGDEATVAELRNFEVWARTEYEIEQWR